jgi:hypothetical protein
MKQYGLEFNEVISVMETIIFTETKPHNPGKVMPRNNNKANK